MSGWDLQTIVLLAQQLRIMCESAEKANQEGRHEVAMQTLYEAREKSSKLTEAITKIRGEYKGS